VWLYLLKITKKSQLGVVLKKAGDGTHFKKCKGDLANDKEYGGKSSDFRTYQTDFDGVFNHVDHVMNVQFPADAASVLFHGLGADA